MKMGPEDFNRSLHMILGLPFDAVTMPQVIARLKAAAISRKRCFLSTPNLNFIIAARSDPAFRQSVFDSDLSLADGMPIVWVARLLGIPLPGRVPGSGLIEALRAVPPSNSKPLRVFFFGGEGSVAAKARDALNATPAGMVCVGAIDPGYGTAAELSGRDHIDVINGASPDFLIVSLGARKGQAWIVANAGKLHVPVVAHLGAVVKFIAGDVARAPAWIQRLGLEWLWRICEEPSLWYRYLRDGLAFSALLGTHVLPLMVWSRTRRRLGHATQIAAVTIKDGPSGQRLVTLGPYLSEENIDGIRDAFRELALAQKPVDLDFSAVRYIDSAFLAQLQVLRSVARSGAFDLRLIAIPHQLKRVAGWYLCDFVLE